MRVGGGFLEGWGGEMQIQRQTDRQTDRQRADSRGSDRLRAGGRPGTGESGGGSVFNDANIFDESEGEDYDEGHAGITKRQEEIIAQNMALVMGIGAEDEGTCGADELGDGIDDEDQHAGSQQQHLDLQQRVNPVAAAAGGVEEGEDMDDGEADPLLAEMKRKAKLRAKRTRELEGVETLRKPETAVAGARDVAVDARQRSPEMEVGRRNANAAPVHSKRRNPDAQQQQPPPPPPPLLQPRQEEPAPALGSDEDTPRLRPSTLVGASAKFGASLEQVESSESLMTSAGVAQGAGVRVRHDATTRKNSGAQAARAAEADEDAAGGGNELRPFSADVPPAKNHKPHDDGSVPIMRMQQCPMTADSLTSRAPTPAALDSPVHVEGKALRDASSSPQARRAGRDSSDSAGSAAMSARPSGSVRGGTGTSAASRRRARDSSPVSPQGTVDGGTWRRHYGEGERESGDEALQAVAGMSKTADTLGAKGSWIQENDEVNALKRRAAQPMSEEAEVRTYSAILTSQLGFLGPLPSVSLPGDDGDDSDATSSHKKRRSRKSQKSRTSYRRDASASPASRASADASILSSDSFDSAISPGDSDHGVAARRPRGKTDTSDSWQGRRVSKWASHLGAEEEEDAPSSGSEEGVPKGFGRLAGKDLMRAHKRERGSNRRKQRRRSPRAHDSSGDEGAVSARRSSHGGAGSDDEDGGGRGGGGSKAGVGYEFREMPDGTTKRCAVVREEDGLLSAHGEGRDKVRARQRGSMKDDDDASVMAPSPHRKTEPAEDMLEKAQRLQREARLLREAAEHARQQEVRREAAERERSKAEAQVVELQRQLEAARNGKAIAMHAQVMQARMGPEASGEDELNAYLSRPLKAAAPSVHAQNPVLQQGNQPGERGGELQRPSKEPGVGDVRGGDKVKGAHDVRRLAGSDCSNESRLACAVGAAATAATRAGEARGMSAAPHASERELAVTHPGASAERRRSARKGADAGEQGGGKEDEDEDEDEDEEEVPVGLKARLESVAASLIQQSWRQQRKRPQQRPQQPLQLRAPASAMVPGAASLSMHASAHALPESSARVGGLAATWAGPVQSRESSATGFGAAAPASVPGALSATVGTSVGIGSIKGRTSTAHTMLGASATGDGLVPATIKALHVALSRSALATPAEAFVWLDRGGKQALSQAALAQGLKTMCATNIEAGQLMFDINPQAPDSRVTPDEFVAALHWAASGTRSFPPPGGSPEVHAQVCEARGRLGEIRARVEAALHRSVMSKGSTAMLSCKTMPAAIESASCYEDIADAQTQALTLARTDTHPRAHMEAADGGSGGATQVCLPEETGGCRLGSRR